VALERIDLQSSPEGSPRYELRDASLFRSAWHGRGASQYPFYEIRGTQIFRSPWHPAGACAFPVFELRADQIFPTPWNEGAEWSRSEHGRNRELHPGS